MTDLWATYMQILETHADSEPKSIKSDATAVETLSDDQLDIFLGHKHRKQRAAEVIVKTKPAKYKRK